MNVEYDDLMFTTIIESCSDKYAYDESEEYDVTEDAVDWIYGEEVELHVYLTENSVIYMEGMREIAGKVKRFLGRVMRLPFFRMLPKNPRSCAIIQDAIERPTRKISGIPIIGMNMSIPVSGKVDIESLLKGGK